MNTNTLCGCGHDMERHNDRHEADPIVTGWFAGNCRMCECKAFTRQEGTPVVMATCDKHSYIHIAGWGCPFCYREAVDKKKREKETHNDDVNDYDLRHLNSQIDSLQLVIGEIYLLSQKDIENGRYEAFNDERRLQRVHVLARKELYGD